MKSLTVLNFSYEYLEKFLGYEPFGFESVLIFFALQGGFLHITSFIIGILQALFFREFRGGGCMGVCAKFLN